MRTNDFRAKFSFFFSLRPKGGDYVVKDSMNHWPCDRSCRTDSLGTFSSYTLSSCDKCNQMMNKMKRGTRTNNTSIHYYSFFCLSKNVELACRLRRNKSIVHDRSRSRHADWMSTASLSLPLYNIGCVCVCVFFLSSYSRARMTQ